MKSWSGEKFWTEIVENKLYPPEAIIKIEGAKTLIQNEIFRRKKVLDHGCGTGWFGKLTQDKGADVIGIDVSEKNLKIAAKRIKVKRAEAANLPFEDDFFDYVLSFMVLQIVDADKALSEINRILKPKGKLFFGIVHPYSEKWNTKTGLTIQDNSSYHKIEKRAWVFNLTDGRCFQETYIHRPLSYYFGLFSKHFYITKLLEPHLPSKFYKDNKYSRMEYLLGEAIKKW